MGRFDNNLTGISYQAQGYGDEQGRLPAWLIDEHKLIYSLYAEAHKDKGNG